MNGTGPGGEKSSPTLAVVQSGLERRVDRPSHKDDPFDDSGPAIHGKEKQVFALFGWAQLILSILGGGRAGW